VVIQTRSCTKSLFGLMSQILGEAALHYWLYLGFTVYNSYKYMKGFEHILILL
jgi:hypothetical protein